MTMHQSQVSKMYLLHRGSKDCNELRRLFAIVTERYREYGGSYQAKDIASALAESSPTPLIIFSASAGE